MARERIDIPLVIDGVPVRPGDTGYAVMPHHHSQVLGAFHRASHDHVRRAIEAARRAAAEWSAWPFEDRAAVFLKAAELLATVEGIKIDRTFISGKIARLSAAMKGRTLDDKKQKEVDDLFREATAKYGDGDYSGANKKLNAIWRAID